MRDAFVLRSELVPEPVTVAVLRPDAAAPDPATPDPATSPLPLLAWLHGGGGGTDFLDQTQPLFEAAWRDGSLPPLVACTPAAGRSFYLDDHEGRVRWETFLVEVLLPEVAARYGASTDPAQTAIAGISMGGMGALRAAFRRPDRFAAVGAVEPAIEPTAEWPEVLLKDRLYRDDALLASLYGDPIDAEHFRANHPLHLAAANAPAIVASGLAILVECGDEDVLGLAAGAEALHEVLRRHAVPHEFHLVRGADHVGPTVAPRLAAALRFVGSALDPRPPTSYPALPDVSFLHQYVAAQEEALGFRRSVTVDGDGGPLEVSLVGSGPPVVLLPSLGRGADDFTDLAQRLGRAGYQAIAPQPRGIGGSGGLRPDLALAALAADVAAVIDALAGGGPAVVVGHAFGNRVARMTATEHPDRVRAVACLAAGGLVAPAPELVEDLAAIIDPRPLAHDPAAHRARVRRVFFAPGQDPAPFLDGWHPATAEAQVHATRTTPVAHWWEAGSAPVLVVQGADDAFAVPANAERLRETAPERVVVRTIPRAGHALLPEQPAAIASALLGWLRDLPW